MTPAILKRKDLVYPELSFKVVGVLLNVYDSLGYGLSEKTYQKAVALAFSEKKIGFVEQLYAPVVFKEKIVAKNFFDFLIEDVLVLELKRGDKFSKAHIEQVFNYLKTKKLKLGILAYFGPSRLHFKRIVNIN